LVQNSKLDNELIVIKSDKNKYLAVVDFNKEFVTNEGKFSFKNIKSIPSKLVSSTGIEFKLYKPSYKEFVLLMKRGPQIIYPKDSAQILIEANIHSSSNILEIGTGSGALTLLLYTMISSLGSLTSLDVSKTNQRRAQKTLSRYLTTIQHEKNNNVNYLNTDLENFNFKELNIPIDTVITDVPEPWIFFEKNKIINSTHWVSYLPSISQISKIKEMLIKNEFEDIEVKEVIVRDWIVEDKILRPSNKLISHTGFIISGKFIKY
jgi:tRNA (adenine57-N1/adenine58-N1)-methyltransferase